MAPSLAAVTERRVAASHAGACVCGVGRAELAQSVTRGGAQQTRPTQHSNGAATQPVYLRRRGDHGDPMGAGAPVSFTAGLRRRGAVVAGLGGAAGSDPCGASRKAKHTSQTSNVMLRVAPSAVRHAQCISGMSSLHTCANKR